MREKIDRFLEKIIDEHLQSNEEGMKKKNNDFLDVLLDCINYEENLDVEFDRTTIKAILLIRSQILLSVIMKQTKNIAHTKCIFLIRIQNLDFQH